jgi:L-2-hydroxycarboxylate dehydrogenase (NAD+)
MVDLLKTPDGEVALVAPEALRTMVTSIFEKLNVSPEDAVLGADVLVSADLRGVDSHGVSNMLRNYVEGYRGGTITPRPNWSVVREALAVATVDCDRGLGIMMAPKAMDIAIQKAKVTGIGMVTMRNGRHLGMASYHAMLALEHNMIGVCTTAVRAIVPPTFGREPRLGTNPIAVAVPAGEEHPFVLDIATSVVPINKIRLAERLGTSIPGGWIADEYGVPLMEAGPVPEQYQLLPLGGTREMGSHKGYGLAAVVEILSGILSGQGYASMQERGNAGHMVAAYDIEAFTSLSEFKRMMDDWMQDLKNTPTTPGNDRVLVPGQLEDEMQRERRIKGIPLHNEVITWFQDISRELMIPYLL